MTGLSLRACGQPESLALFVVVLSIFFKELPMKATRLYQILLLPSREIVARHQTLAEASAWVRTYNEAAQPPAPGPVIAEEPELRESGRHSPAQAA